MVSVYDKKDGRAARHLTVDTLVEENRLDAAYVADHPESHDAVRDSKFFEAAMQWVHHLSESARSEWHALTDATVPLLPNRGGAEMSADLRANGHDALADKSEEVVSCQTGHNAEAFEAGNWTGFPDWPDEITYKAKGYGPYPFWYSGSAASGDLTGAGADITTYWSGVQNSERLEHSTCTQSIGGTSGDACTHLFVDKWAALFGADESWCCWSSTPNLPSCFMSTVKRGFQDLFTYNGISDYTSESGLYSGQVKNYTMTLTSVPNFWFWYYTGESMLVATVDSLPHSLTLSPRQPCSLSLPPDPVAARAPTDLDDKPVEQGEGSCVMPRGCGGVKYMFHQYNQSAFEITDLTDTDKFTFPDVCLDTQETCTVSPTSLCDADGR